MANTIDFTDECFQALKVIIFNDAIGVEYRASFLFFLFLGETDNSQEEQGFYIALKEFMQSQYTKHFNKTTTDMANLLVATKICDSSYDNNYYYEPIKKAWEKLKLTTQPHERLQIKQDLITLLTSISNIVD